MFSNAAFNGSDILLLESDDLVLEIKYTSPSAYAMKYWYVKQDPRRMLSEESARQSDLSCWKSATLSKHRDAHLYAIKMLDILRDVIHFYLG